jgi:pyruvate kinase
VLDPVWDVLAKVNNGGGAGSPDDGRGATSGGGSPTSFPSSSIAARAAAGGAASPAARKTKIVCTIGPATNSREAFFALADSGMDVVRLNMSHGTHESHGAVIALAKEYNQIVREGKGGRAPLGILLDTRGPEVRSGDVQEPLQLKPGDAVIFTRDPSANGRDNRVGVNYEDFPDDVLVGDELLVDGGIITFRVDAKDEATGDVRCVTVDGGAMGSRRHLNVRGRSANLPALTDRDMEDLRFGLEAGVDYYALSFVRDAQVLYDVKAWLAKNGGSRIRVLAKIESADSVQRLDEILDAADGAMVARGDLGAELAVADVPYWQGVIIDGCRRRGKPVITATNMLESLCENPIPTRAEVSDIAISVREGTDAVMLSGETAYGRYPLRAVSTMAAVAQVTESAMARYSGARRFGTDEAAPIDWVGAPLLGADAGPIGGGGGGGGSMAPSPLGGGARSPSAAAAAGRGSRSGRAASAAAAALSELMAFHSVTIGDTAGFPLLVFSRTGGMPALLSHYRPHRPVFVATDSTDVQQRLTLYHGIVPLYVPSLAQMGLEQAIDGALAELLCRGLLKPREHVVVVQSGRRPIWRAASTHVIQLRCAEKRHARAARELRVARQLESGAANLENAAAAAAAEAAAARRGVGRGVAGAAAAGVAGAAAAAPLGAARALSSFGGGGANGSLSSLNVSDDEDYDEDEDDEWDYWEDDAGVGDGAADD